MGGHHDARPVGHFGLAAPLCLHFTSPLRRYADLVVHRTVKAYLRGQRDFSPLAQQLPALTEHINERARAAAHAETVRARMMMARYMGRRIGEMFEGRITRARAFGALVQLDATAVEGMVPTEQLGEGPWTVDARETALTGPAGKRWAVGMPMRVRVTGADEELGRVEFAPG